MVLNPPYDLASLNKILSGVWCALSAVHVSASRPCGAQVGRRAHGMLAEHMQRYCYSAMGALRWKRDVTEYADVLRNSHSPTTNAQARPAAIAHNV